MTKWQVWNERMYSQPIFIEEFDNHLDASYCVGRCYALEHDTRDTFVIREVEE